MFHIKHCGRNIEIKYLHSQTKSIRNGESCQIKGINPAVHRMFNRIFPHDTFVEEPVPLKPVCELPDHKPRPNRPKFKR